MQCRGEMKEPAGWEAGNREQSRKGVRGVADAVPGRNERTSGLGRRSSTRPDWMGW
jgi:hypothetical protein